MSGVGGREGSPSRKVKGEKMRKNCGTRQSKDVSQHQRTSALYIGTDVRYGVLSLSPHHFSFSFPFFFVLVILIFPLLFRSSSYFSFFNFPSPCLVRFRCRRRETPRFLAHQSNALHLQKKVVCALYYRGLLINVRNSSGLLCLPKTGPDFFFHPFY